MTRYQKRLSVAKREIQNNLEKLPQVVTFVALDLTSNEWLVGFDGQRMWVPAVIIKTLYSEVDNG